VNVQTIMRKAGGSLHTPMTPFEEQSLSPPYKEYHTIRYTLNCCNMKQTIPTFIPVNFVTDSCFCVCLNTID